MKTYSTKKLLKKFDKLCEKGQDTLVDKLGEEKAIGLITQARSEYEKIIPEIPWIGGKRNDHTRYLLISAECLAFFRTLDSWGFSVEESKNLLYSTAEDMLHSYPKSLAKFLGGLTYSKLYINRLKSQSKIQEKFPDKVNWPFTVVEGDGENFDYGFDYSSCGVCKFYKAQEAEEFTSFMCSLDFPVSDYLEMGLTRDKTIALGDNICTFRYKNVKKTKNEE